MSSLPRREGWISVKPSKSSWALITPKPARFCPNDGTFPCHFTVALRSITTTAQRWPGNRRQKSVELERLYQRLKGSFLSTIDVTAATGMLIVPRGDALRRPLLDKLSHLVRQGVVSPTVYGYS